jgi:hypothetical protein
MKVCIQILEILMAVIYMADAFHFSTPPRSSPCPPCNGVSYRHSQLSASFTESIFGWLPGYPKYKKSEIRQMTVSKEEREEVDKFIIEAKSIVDEADAAIALADSALAMDPEDVFIDWSEITITGLKNELKVHGLEASGKKTDLIARLTSYLLEVDPEKENENIAVSVPYNEAAKVASDSSDKMTFSDDDAAVKSKQVSLATAKSKADPVKVEVATNTQHNSPEDFKSKSVAELKVELRCKGLRVGGKKSELIQRLLSHSDSSSPEVPKTVQVVDTPQDFKTLTVGQLKIELRSKGLKVGGKKAELIERLEGAASVA